MNVEPGATYEAVIDTGTPGKVGVYGVELNDNLGGVTQAFSTSGLFEIAGGVYTVTKTAPLIPGQYTLIWRDSPGGLVLGVEDLYVTTAISTSIGAPPILPTVGVMTFKQIQDECCNFRFGEGRRNSVKFWINRRMQAVWGEAEWPFKRVNREWVLTDTNGQLVMPEGFRRGVALERQDGQMVTYMVAEEFRNNFPTNIETDGSPTTYTTWNSQILFDANPGFGAAFLLSYLRRICIRDSTGLLREGLLTQDGDSPLWDPEHHFLLVIGATATGLKLENDFTWQALEEEFGQALTEMKDDLLPPDLIGTTQYGADNL